MSGGGVKETVMAWQEQLAHFLAGGHRFAVLGIGSVMRADDAAGSHIIRLLGKMVSSPQLLLLDGAAAPENCTGVIRHFQPDRLLIIDAAHMGLSPGEAAIVNLTTTGGLPISTHRLPLPVLAGYLNQEAGCGLLIIGIQPATTEYDGAMTRAVKDGARRLAGQLAADLKEQLNQPVGTIQRSAPG
jgi:hydrogenase 3 maturation protease